MRLPDGHVVDIHGTVLNKIALWLQDDSNKPESGGFIVGYEHSHTGNISLEDVSQPCFIDKKTRVRFVIRDPRHYMFLKRARKQKSYYMGVWHTHPQRIPHPSSIDWNDWNETISIDKTGSNYVFFIIAGTVEWKLWAGDMKSGIITEIQECPKDDQGIYL